MNGWVIIALAAIAFVAGVVTALHYQSKRAININVSSSAVAHGGSAHGATSAAPVKSGNGSGILGTIKFFVAAGLALLCVLLFINLLSRPAAQPNIIVNVPTQEAPRIVVDVPSQKEPNITVSPQPVIVSPPVAESPQSTLMLLLSAAGLITVIITCLLVFRRLRTNDEPPKYVAPTPDKYIRTSYGWTPITQDNNPPAAQGEKKPDLVSEFFKKTLE